MSRTNYTRRPCLSGLIHLTKLIISILTILTQNICIAQYTSDPINQIDDYGQKTGRWIILFDENWKETNNKNEAFYFRDITYVQGKPSGLTTDYYLNGQLQWKGRLISENPDVYDGEAVWFSEDGKIIDYGYFVNGIIDSDETFRRLNNMNSESRTSGLNATDRTQLGEMGEKTTYNLNALISGQKFQYNWREGGAVYGWYYKAETHYCPSGKYITYVHGEKTTVMDNTQYSNNTVYGTWEISDTGGQIIIKHFDQYGNDFINKYHIPIHIQADGSFSISKNHHINISVQKLGIAVCY